MSEEKRVAYALDGQSEARHVLHDYMAGRLVKRIGLSSSISQSKTELQYLPAKQTLGFPGK